MAEKKSAAAAKPAKLPTKPAVEVKSPIAAAKAAAEAKPAAKPAVASKATATKAKAAIDPAARLRMIQECAYLNAAKRGFAHGRELEDWLAAEREVDARLRAHS